MAAGSCDLCGLPLPNPPIEREVGGETKRFCCEGCARVYEVAHDSEMLDQVLPQARKNTRASIKDLLPQQGESAYFNIEGMWCAGCSLAAERVLRRQPGVREADISFAAERGRIEYDPELADPEKLLSALSPLGYQARLTSSKAQQQKERLQERISLQLITAVAFGMQVMMLYLAQLYPLYTLGQFQSTTVVRIQYAVWALATPALFFGGLTFLRGAWRALLARTANMDTLVALGVLSAYGYSVYITLTGSGETYFDSVIMIVTFILFGRYLETVGGAQARKDLRSLLHLQPEFGWRKAENGWQKVQAEDLAVGDVILIKPGERVPADGILQTGSAQMDESMLTGESRPVKRVPDDPLYAGTLVQEGAPIARVTASPGSTRLAQIAGLVTQTLSSKPPIQRLADRASTYFAIGILMTSVLTFAGWQWLGYPLAQAVLAAVAVLVVACPCALGLATPLALSVTLSKASQNGVLVRSPSTLETAALVKRVVFDKTGTLTRGQLSVALVQPAADLGEVELLRLAAAVEQFSEHPLAKAIVKAAPPELPPAGEFVAVRGSGASARVMDANRQRVVVGSDHMVAAAPGSPLAHLAGRRAALGDTIVWVARENDVLGFLSLHDEPDPAVRPAVEQLQAKGIRLAVLSGDSLPATKVIAEQLGLGEYDGGCLPEQKAERIRDWQKAGEQVAMVGDGVNDAPALAQADLSITAAGGSDIAGQTSDLVLIRPDLTLVPWFFQLSRRTRRIILENLGWAFAYNLVAVPLAVLGLLSPALAAAAMATSSLLVVFNSLRLRKA